MKKINVITIDGPSASGKGALARQIASKFSLNILDSGILYRLFAYFDNLAIAHSEIAKKIQQEIKFNQKKDRLQILNNEKDITSKLRSEDIAKTASKLSSQKEVRSLLFNIQRSFYTSEGLVADGRDMGTVVFKDAKLKIFLNSISRNKSKKTLYRVAESWTRS
ncbi:MAG: (d)CMP kinase [Gammaproteobacteria bacterium]